MTKKNQMDLIVNYDDDDDDEKIHSRSLLVILSSFVRFC